MGQMFDVNFLAVLFAAVVNMILGMFWYSPALFGRQWMSLVGLTEADRESAKEKGMGKSYLAGFIGALLIAFVLAIFIGYAGANTIAAGIKTGILAWLGFVVPVLLGTILWEGKPVKLYFINIGFYLFSLSIMGAILGALG